MKAAKTERMHLRLTPEELAMVNRLSDTTGLSLSDVVRQAIRRWHAELPEPPPSRKKR